MRTALAWYFVVITAVGCCAQEPLAETLRRGIVAEETNQDLNAAMQAYQSVLARFNEDRKAAATALFRMGEIFRKQGKADLATAAYRRLVQEFADQSELVKSSKQRLGKEVSSTDRQHSNGTDAGSAELLRKYRSILEQQIRVAEQSVQRIRRELELGNAAPADLYQPEEQLARFHADLAAFDAGLIPRQPPAPANAEAKRARDEYRKLLQIQIGLAAKDLNWEQKKYDLGTSRIELVLQKQMKLLQLERDLAAFDAGFGVRPSRESQLP